MAYSIQIVKAEPATWTVDDDEPADFASIQEAVNSPLVADGDTIFVREGTYYERLVVDKTVLLIGEDVETTILNAGNALDAVDITANNVFVSGLTITSADTGILLSSSGCVISGNSITLNKDYGIRTSNFSSNNVFSENNITNSGYGIYFNDEYYGCWFDNNTITRNQLSNNSIAAIAFFGSYSWAWSSGNVISENLLTNNTLGIQMMWGSNNTISGNRIAAIEDGINLVMQRSSAISENTIIVTNGDGVSLRADWSYHGPSRSHYTNISRNVIAVENGNGVAVSGCYSNAVSRNNITAIDGNGVYLYPYRNYDYGTYWDIPSQDNLVSENSLTSMNGNCIRVINSSSNSVYHNDFFAQNSGQAHSENSENAWDNGYPSGGNYWSDYAGADANGDGMGDTPYIIDDCNRDNYPLMEPWTPTRPSIVASVNINIDVLNLQSKGRWITAYIQLPEGCDPADVDGSTVLLNGTVSPVLDPKYGFVTNSSEYLLDHNGDGMLERMVKFSRADVASWIHDEFGIQYGSVTLTVTGELYRGTSFEATAAIKVLFLGDTDDDGDVDFDDFHLSRLQPGQLHT